MIHLIARCTSTSTSTFTHISNIFFLLLVSVVEVVPPAVNTDLGGVGLHTFGEPLNEFADSVFGKMLESDDNVEIGYKMSESLRTASAEQRETVFKALNRGSH